MSIVSFLRKSKRLAFVLPSIATALHRFRVTATDVESIFDPSLLVIVEGHYRLIRGP